MKINFDYDSLSKDDPVHVYDAKPKPKKKIKTPTKGSPADAPRDRQARALALRPIGAKVPRFR